MMKNLGQMMKQVQELQERMQAVQAKLETLSIEGRAGGGLVQVTLNGKGAMMALALDESLLKPGDSKTCLWRPTPMRAPRWKHWLPSR
jgi:nucleoid-associated protein EbfC